MYGDRHRLSRDRTWERFFVLALEIYNWPLDIIRQQYQYWNGGIRDIRISDATLCLMEMASGGEDLCVLVRRHNLYYNY